ncbi:MAG TPA: hypothetical protein VHB98_11985 [Chloroflexota bacterium]|jgi:hypothetical protein|nr:hypothetical protein [Chloroflexota bacterium]
MRDATKWVPLRYYLRARRTRDPELTLRFRQIEDILGDGLPKPARKSADWWANDAATAQALAWLEVGWRVKSVDLAGETVSFELHDG